ncbi:MAG: hypothetical protein WDO68_22140 [Gammaproteobacteria bacterium]
MDHIRLDQLPPPLGAKKGRYKHVRGYGAPVWVEDKFDWWFWIKRAGMVIAPLAALAAVAKALSLI